jgi:HD-GYP domain-containing protein (c-di-GMP phosphodiesterase class II)
VLTDGEKLEILTNLSMELNQLKDLDILMERILTEARRFVNADAGSIYIRDKDRLLFRYSQNDTLQKRLPKGSKLGYSNYTIPIDQNSITGYSAVTGRAVNIQDVYNLDSTVPYRFSRKFDDESGYRTRSALAIPLKTLRGDIVGALQIINAQNEQGKIISFSEDNEKLIYHFASTAAVALERAQLTRTIILRMIGMAELRDPKETAMHVSRVGGYSVELYEHWAKQRNMDKKDIEAKLDVLRMAAMLHDVGKIAISDQILRKPGRFTEDEYDVMKQHTVLGARLFIDKRSDFDEAALETTLNHHERWDGRGYPGHVDLEVGGPLDGLQRAYGKSPGKKGHEIPLFGRIVAVADVYDALSSKRVYKEAWDDARILKVLEEGVDRQFDPDLIEIFFSCFDLLKSIQKRYPDEKED